MPAKPTQTERPAQMMDGRKISEMFGESIFSMQEMREHLDGQTYEKMRGVILEQKPMEFSIAEAVAQALIRWAMDKGATHYTHWFHPLTNSSAEKHDAFFQPSIDLEKKGIESLSGSRLMQQEPDGSSFPSGGLRVTHEARSYTVWDPSSPPFILDSDTGRTLYVPAVFVSYTGDSLDQKTPLLKANYALNQAATSICKLLGHDVSHVFSTLGWEQEYFIVDETFVNDRPDLLLFGRTIFGKKSAKGQQMDDHYFGAIPQRVQEFMHDFERESLRLGIPIVTRHNEVAPGQFECAPVFEEANVAVDHNILIMELMRRIAVDHGLRVLMHEKPFAGLNGNGKHNNWSLATNTGANLLSQGDSAASNLTFLTFFINTIKAIGDHDDLVRASIASSGNDHRLGANEAPPAILSVYVGAHLDAVLDNFMKNGLSSDTVDKPELIDLNLTKIHPIERDNCDRNRTSPFAFIGNRFELRAVGAQANCAAPMTVINSVVANQLRQFQRDVEAKGGDTQAAIIEVLQSYAKDLDRVIFNGDGYSDAWQEEAAKRGLSNNKTTPTALKCMIDDRSKALFGELSVFSERELEARYEVQLENYANRVSMEATLFHELSRTYVLPPTYEMVNKLGETHRNLTALNLTDQAKAVEEQIATLSSAASELHNGLTRLTELEARADSATALPEAAGFYADEVKPLFEQLRVTIDELEAIVEDKLWILPKYRELLYIR